MSTQVIKKKKEKDQILTVSQCGADRQRDFSLHVAGIK